MNTMKSRWILGWIPFILASALIFHGSTLSPRALPPIFLRLDDKLVHGLEYFILFLLSANAFKRASQKWLVVYAASLAFGYCVLMGAVTETAQFFVPGRVPDLMDWAVDGLGAAFAWLILFFTALLSGKPSHELL